VPLSTGVSTVAAAATADVAALPTEIEAGSAERAEGGGDVRETRLRVRIDGVPLRVDDLTGGVGPRA
jgi:hypothetical protein